MLKIKTSLIKGIKAQTLFTQVCVFNIITLAFGFLISFFAFSFFPSFNKIIILFFFFTLVIVMIFISKIFSVYINNYLDIIKKTNIELIKNNSITEIKEYDYDNEFTQVIKSYNQFASHYSSTFLKEKNLINSLKKSNVENSELSNIAVAGSKQIEDSLSSLSSNSIIICNYVNDSINKVTQLNNAINDISNFIKNIALLSKEANEASDKGKNLSSEIEKDFVLINDSFNKESEIINYLNELRNEIDEISNEIKDLNTKLTFLSFNAAIEATRAGREAKGMFVIVEEIKKISAQSQASNQKIGSITSKILSGIKEAIKVSSNSQNYINKGSKSVSQTNEILKDIYSKSALVNDNVNQIIGEIQVILNSSATMIDKISHISTLSEEASASSSNVELITKSQGLCIEDINSNMIKFNDLIIELIEFQGEKATDTKVQLNPGNPEQELLNSVKGLDKENPEKEAPGLDSPEQELLNSVKDLDKENPEKEAPGLDSLEQELLNSVKDLDKENPEKEAPSLDSLEQELLNSIEDLEKDLKEED